MKYVFGAQVRVGSLIPWLLFLVADGFLLFTDTRWVGELTWAVEWANGGLYLSSSLLAALVVFLNRRLLSAESLVVLGVGGWAARGRHIGAIWVKFIFFGMSAHAVVCAVALGWTLAAGTTDSLAWEPFVYALLPIGYAVTLGVLVAALVPSIVGAALALVFSYVLGYLAAIGTLQLPVIVGGITGSMVGITYSGSVLLQYLAVTCVIVLLGLGGALLVISARSVSAEPWVFIAVLLGVIVIPSLLVPVFPDRGMASNRPVAYECADTAPRVCVLDGHTTRLPALSRAIEKAAEPLAHAGVQVRSLVLREEPLGSNIPTGDRPLALDTSRLNRADFSNEELANALAQPGRCYQDTTGEGRARLEQDSYNLSQWISGFGPARSHTWARATFDSLASCST